MPGPGPNAPLRLPPPCTRCGSNKVAWTQPRVDFCYACLPGGPFSPPPCRACGSPEDYFSQGLCAVCHPRSSKHPGACKGCLAWGVYAKYNWTCWSCRVWRSHYPEGVCAFCGRTSWIGHGGECRLCWVQAQLLREPGQPLDLAAANAHSQQLFLANMVFKRRRTPDMPRIPQLSQADEPWRRRDKNYLPYPADTEFADTAWVQLALFDLAPDPEVVRRRVQVTDTDLTRYCAAIVNEHSARYGWSVRQRNSVIRSLRVLQTLRDTPTAKIRASDVIKLRRYDGVISSTLDVLTEADLLIEDVPTRVEKYFATTFNPPEHDPDRAGEESGDKTVVLPSLMRQHLELWLQIMLGGSRQSPRQLPRDPATVENYIRSIAPIVQAWADGGYQSFAEVTRADIAAGLPAKATDRHFAETGLKTLFKTLKGRGLVFADPARGLKPTPVATNIPLPLDPALVRAELNSPHPATALAVALVAFHALTTQQLRFLQLTDIVDGRLRIGDRDIPLAAPVRTRLAAWLDHRGGTWPYSINPHLFINRRTAPRLIPTGPSFPLLGSTLRAQALREDRILHEIHATGGDVRRICDFFGLSFSGATRYLGTVEHPDLKAEHPTVPRK